MSKFGEWLANELSKRRWSQRKLAREAGVSSGMVSEVVSNSKSPGWGFCEAIARPLGKTPLEVFQIAGLLPEGNAEETRATYYARSLTEKEIELVELHRQLNEFGQDAVLTLALGLRDRGRQLD